MRKSRQNKKLTIAFLITAFTILGGCGKNNISTDLQSGDTTAIFSSKKAKNANELSLSTYNIKNLFTAANAGKAEKQRQALSKAIHEINSDIIAFQEVESKTVLKNFTEKYLKDLNYNLFINDVPGQVKVAVLSRFPVSQNKNNLFNKPKNGPPGPVVPLPVDLLNHLDFKVNNNYTFHVFTAYLKPFNAPGYSQEKKDTDIQRIKAFFRGFQNLDVNFAVMANLNEKPEAMSLQTLLDPRSSGMNFHDVIAEDLGKGSDVYTVFNPKKIRQDYLLVSAGMFSEYTTGSVVIHKPVQEGSTVKNTFFQEASDHLPVTAKFDITQDLR